MDPISVLGGAIAGGVGGFFAGRSGGNREEALVSIIEAADDAAPVTRFSGRDRNRNRCRFERGGAAPAPTPMQVMVIQQPPPAAVQPQVFVLPQPAAPAPIVVPMPAPAPPAPVLVWGPPAPPVIVWGPPAPPAPAPPPTAPVVSLTAMTPPVASAAGGFAAFILVVAGLQAGTAATVTFPGLPAGVVPDLRGAGGAAIVAGTPVPAGAYGVNITVPAGTPAGTSLQVEVMSGGVRIAATAPLVA